MFTDWLDVDAAKRINAFREAGLPDEGLLEVARVMGMAMAQVAGAYAHAHRRGLLEPGLEAEPDGDQRLGSRRRAGA